MKNILTNKYFLIAAALIIGLLLGKFIFSGSEAADAAHDHNAETTQGKTQIWTCSMHPQIRKTEPGKCPICGMELIPADNGEEDSNPMAVTMSPTAMKLADVQTMVVSKERPVKVVRLNGKVEADERLISIQTSHIAGRIEQLLVNFTGETVRKGQTIAYVYSPELYTAQEELLEAYDDRDRYPEMYTAAREKLKFWKLTDKQIDEIIRTKEIVENFPILSDLSGVVISKRVNLGDHVMEGSPLFEIADLSRVWVLFDVYENDMPWVSVGDEVEFTIQSLPGKQFKGKISFIDPVIDPKTRVARARVNLDNPGMLLKPEMFASGIVKSPLKGNGEAIIIPKSAVMWTGTRSIVYVKLETDEGIQFLMREVILGPSLGSEFVIDSGLNEGEEIAVNGTFSIDAAAQLAGKPSMMNPEGGPAMTGHNHGGAPPAAAPSTSGKEAKTIQSISVSRKAKAALKPLVDQYLDMRKALAADDMKKAQEAGMKMRNTLNNIDMKLFEGDAHLVWMENSGKMEKALEHIEHYDKIDNVRDAFRQVSEAMVVMVKSFDPYDATLYVQHCPMANNNKGADWVSEIQEIKNPYFGSEMPGCGEITDTIK